MSDTTTNSMPVFAIDPDGLTKLTVNITPRARLSMEVAAERLGDTQTDTVSRALITYAEICLAPAGIVITVGDLVIEVKKNGAAS